MKPLGLYTVFLFTLAACQQEPGNQNLADANMNPAAISGTVSYREHILLNSGSRLEIALDDVSRADAPALVIADKSIFDPGQVPISFTLPLSLQRSMSA